MKGVFEEGNAASVSGEFGELLLGEPGVATSHADQVSGVPLLGHTLSIPVPVQVPVYGR
jgi:hypothetical protein